MIHITILVPKKKDAWKISIDGGHKSYKDFGSARNYIERTLTKKFVRTPKQRIKVLADYGKIYDTKKNEWINGAVVETPEEAIDMMKYFVEDYL